MARPRDYDWDLIRSIFVEGEVDEDGRRTYPNAQELANRFGCHPNYLRRKSQQKNWLKDRTNFLELVEKKRLDTVLKKISSDAADFDLKCLKAAEKIVESVINDIEEAEKLDITIEPGERLILSQTLHKAQQVGRLALGQSTDKVENIGNTEPTGALNLNVDFSEFTEAELQLIVGAGLKIRGSKT